MIKTAIKNLQKFKKDIVAFDKAQKRAYVNAVKIEAYRLRTQLRNEYQKGMTGWPPMKEISKLSRAYQLAYGVKGPAGGHAITTYPGSGIPAPDYEAPPTYGLAVPIRYKVTKSGNKTLAEIGVMTKGKTSKSWQRVAWKQQEGFKIPLTDELREYFYNVGMKMRGEPIGFSPNTKQLTIPSRESIRPFWQRNKGAAWNHIKSNYVRLQKKERIYTSEGEYI